jgi:hypothetical protein
MRLGFTLLVMALMASLSVPALAQGRRPEERAPGVQPLDRILPEVRRSHPGEFYDADGPTTGPGGREHYLLNWMRPVGRVEWLDTDARTGRVLGSSPSREGPGAQRRDFAPAPSIPTPRFDRREERGAGAERGGGYGERFGGRGFGGGDRFGGRGDFGGREGFGGRGGGRGDFGGRGRHGR